MTYEQETKQISDFLRMNCGCFSPSGVLTAAADRLDDQAGRIAELEDVLRAVLRGDCLIDQHGSRLIYGMTVEGER